MIDLPALFDDVSSGFLKSLSSGVIKAYLQRRERGAREILLEEVRKANITMPAAASEDDAIATMFRFERAVLEGTARLNLRLMAKALAGRLQLGRLVADEFLLYADALATLSRDEIIFIAELIKATKARKANPDLPPVYANVAATPWTDAKSALENSGWSEGRVWTAATRAQRSGLVAADSAWGGLVFETTEMLRALLVTVDFEDALRAES